MIHGEQGKIFYEDQQSSRESCLSEEIDEDFEKEKQAQFEGGMEREEQFVLESSFINEEKTEQVTPRPQRLSVLTYVLEETRNQEGA